jgi:hypothetical protein
MRAKVVHLQQLWGGPGAGEFDVSVVDVPDLFNQVQTRLGRKTLVWRDSVTNAPNVLSVSSTNLPEGVIYYTGGKSSRRVSSRRRASRRASRRGGSRKRASRRR